jgi:2-polyprenyl-3-methyl-5-hydroxy-6-metoxy-1,4-benzoquinol methylase
MGVLIQDPQAHAQYRQELERHLRSYYGSQLGLPPDKVESEIDRRLKRTRGESLASLLDEHVGLEGRRLLDVGCGWGELILSCLLRGAEGCGVEPDADEVEISRLLLRSYGYSEAIYRGVGERLPFADDEFDIVTCQQVLEHVSSIEQVVREIVRVTRPGGFVVVSVPNYLFPYEGHYMMKWFPLTPKSLGRLILKAKGRDPNFLVNHVNYTTYPRLTKLWRAHGLEVRNLTRERVIAGQHGLPLYRWWAGRTLALRLNLFPNITWLLRKPTASSVRSRQASQ